MRMNLSDRSVSPFSCTPAHLCSLHLPIVLFLRKSSLFRSTPHCKPATRYRSQPLPSFYDRTPEVSRHFHTQRRESPSRCNPGTSESPFAVKPSRNLVETDLVQQRRLFWLPDAATFACPLTSLVNDCFQSPEKEKKIGTFIGLQSRAPLKRDRV